MAKVAGTLTEGDVKAFVSKIFKDIGKKVGVKGKHSSVKDMEVIDAVIGYGWNYGATWAAGMIAQSHFRTRHFDGLKRKYQSVLDLISTRGVARSHVDYKNDKLFIQGVCPSQHIKNVIWDQIRSVDPSYGRDLTCDLSVGAGAAA